MAEVYRSADVITPLGGITTIFEKQSSGPTRRYKNSYNTTISSEPDTAIQQAHDFNITTNYSFPLSADNFNDVGQSQHTMQILAYPTTVDKYLQNLWSNINNLKDQLSTQAWSAVSSAISTLTSGGTLSQQQIKDLQTAFNTGASVDFNQLKDYRINTLKPEAIFTFYMPSPIIFQQDNDYEEIGLTGWTMNKLLPEASHIGGTEAGFSDLAGYPINPKVEILYDTTPQRKFQFEFRLSPSSEAEAVHLEEMIKKLRMTAAPTRQGVGGIIWKAPDTYDIKFLHNGEENTKIPKINECVCHSIEVDYTSTSGDLWSTFRTGHPVTTRIKIDFQEKEVLDRENVERGF